MPVRIKSITMDCRDPYGLAQFWAQLTGFVEDPEDGNAPGDSEALLLAPDGLALLFISVPEPKSGKNRVHLDLVPRDRTRDDEVDRVIALGARMVDDQRRPDGTGWAVLADPEGNEFCIVRSDPERTTGVEQLGQTLAAVGDLIAEIQPEQWSAPTPCEDWPVRRLVDHLIGMNQVFVALLADQPMPRRDPEHRESDPVGAFRDSAASLLAGFSQPGVQERTYRGPLGEISGADRLQIRLYDLIAHGWDLAQAIGRPLPLPGEVAEQSLAYVRTQLVDADRPGRFGPIQPVADDAPAIERLVAFLGRPVTRSE